MTGHAQPSEGPAMTSRPSAPDSLPARALEGKPTGGPCSSPGPSKVGGHQSVERPGPDIDPGTEQLRRISAEEWRNRQEELTGRLAEIDPWTILRMRSTTGSSETSTKNVAIKADPLPLKDATESGHGAALSSSRAPLGLLCRCQSTIPPIRQTQRTPQQASMYRRRTERPGPRDQIRSYSSDKRLPIRYSSRRACEQGKTSPSGVMAT